MRGFSLIEMLVTISLCGLLVSAGTYLALGSLGRSDAQGTLRTIRTALLEARADSIHGLCQRPACTEAAAHGVHLESGRLVLFEGPSYSGRDQAYDEILPFDTDAAIDGPEELVFSPDGTLATVSGTITARETSVESYALSVNAEGMISSIERLP